MSESIGEIQLDLVVNQGQFNKQMLGISSLAKKTGAALAGAFAIKKIVNFGKECLELGSDLAEVQNVVDVSFPTMSAKINDFAKGAAASFGLSETMAKKFTGTFGAMASAFGFTEKESLKMSTALTGLAGDVASFYNISQDEAYTKLKSVFTGETETLKDLGVVMTQTALDSYALANGYGKVTSKMTEQEKVALRYKFVTEQLTKASGDFARTSDSWANQTRLLSLQFDSLKASIGQGLINAFTPIIKVINTVMQKLNVLMEKFAQLTGKAFGKQDTEDSVSGYEDMAVSADKAADSAANVGKSAKKAAKEVKNSTLSFDKINKLDANSSSSPDTSFKSGAGAGNVSSIGDGEGAKQSGMLEELKKKINQVGALFAKGFKLGSGNLPQKIKSIKSHLAGIGKSLNDIFTDSQVQAAFTKLVALMIENAGKITGSIASIGATMADNLIGGLDIFLQKNKGRIKQYLISMFNITSEISTIKANFAMAVADIFSVFGEYDAKSITASIISIISQAFMGVNELCAKIGRDILNFITKPIIDNKGSIKDALRNTLKPLSTVFRSLESVSSSTWDKIQSTYDQSVKPLLDSLANGISGWMKTFLDGYNTYIAPVLATLSEKFKSVMDSSIKPAINAVIGLLGNLIDIVKIFWENVLQPLVNWCIKNIVPIFAEVFKTAGSIILEVFGGISKVIGGISNILSGVCGVIKGEVQGDWKSAWESAKSIVKAVVTTIKEIFTLAVTVIKTAFTPLITFFKSIWNSIKNVFSNVANFFSTKFTLAVTVIKTTFTALITFFKTLWNSIKSVFSNVAGFFESTFSTAWEKVKNVFSAGSKVFKGIKSGIETVFKTIVNHLISGINKVVSTPFNAINGMLNKIHDISVLGKKPFSGLWDKDPLAVPEIPKLATGGYVKKNTPQLAMIGDNRHQGEVVAPEDKLLAMASQAAELSGSGGMTARVVELLEMILYILEKLDLTLYVDGEKLSRNVVRNINRRTSATGHCDIVIR
jgi:phage-related protein|nr:MAG TPA: minor tail protein [Caudoviricetes sp.]